MKLFALIGILFCVPAFAQPDGWVQEDCGEGHIVICKQKKKVGIWSNARGEFIEPAHKGHVLHFPEAQIILDVYPKEKEVKTYHYFKGGIQELESPYPDGRFAFCNIFGEMWNKKFETKLDGRLWESRHVSIGDSAVYAGIDPDKDDHKFEDSLNYKFDGDFLIVKLSHQNYRNPNPIGLITKDGMMDSLDENGELVYQPDEVKYVLNSGVYNLKIGKWEVPPKYVNVKKWENVYAAYYWPYQKEGDNSTLQEAVSYDFYIYDDKTGINPTHFLGYQGFAFPLELWPFEDEKVWYDTDSTFIYHQGKKGTGIYEIPLTAKETTKHGYDLENGKYARHFEVKEILEAKYEYAFLSGHKDQYNSPAIVGLQFFGSKGDDFFDIKANLGRWDYNDTLITDVLFQHSFETTLAYYYEGDSSYYEEPVFLVDDTTIIRPTPYKESSELFEVKDREFAQNVKESRLTYYIIRAPGERFVVNSWYEEDMYRYYPVQSVIDGYDSIDVNGNVVYEYNDPGHYNSGVFDGKTNSWLVPEKNIFVSYVKDGFLIEEPVFLEKEETFRNLKTSVVSFIDANGKYIFKSKDINELFENWENLSYAIQGFNTIKMRRVDPSDDRTVYFQTENGTGCARINRLTSSIHISPKDMVMFANYHQILYAENNELIVRFEGFQDRNGDTVEFKIPKIPGLKVQINGPNRTSKFDFFSEESQAYGPNSHRCYVLLNDSLGCHYLTDQKGRAFKYFDTLKYKIPNVKADDIWTTFDDNEMKDEWEMNIEVLDESRIYIRNRKKDDTYLVAIKSKVDYYDSIDANGNVVFYPPECGYETSGVYNIETNQWEIEPKYMQIASISGDNYLLKESIRGEYNILKGYKTILKQGDQEKILHEENINGMSDEKFTVGILNDSLVIINHYKIYEPEKPYMSLIYGDDSLDTDGNTVFAPASPAINNSGVYNVYTNEWAISPQNEWIYTFKNTFIVETPVFGENGRKSMVFYHIYDKDGKSLQVGLSYDELSPEQQERITAKY